MARTRTRALVVADPTEELAAANRGGTALARRLDPQARAIRKEFENVGVPFERRVGRFLELSVLEREPAQERVPRVRHHVGVPDPAEAEGGRESGQHRLYGERAVAGHDEDSLTLAVNAALHALFALGLDRATVADFTQQNLCGELSAG